MAPRKNLLRKAAVKIVGKPKRIPLKKKASDKQVSAKKGATPKKTTLKKKVSAKKVATKKVAVPKKTPLKKKVLDKKVAAPKRTYSKVSGLSTKKLSTKKAEPKKADVKKPMTKKPTKKSPLKKKLASKKATALAKKVGKSSAKILGKMDSTRLNTTSKSSDERAARAAKRQTAKEDSLTLGPKAKRARLGQDVFPKEDLVDLISASDGVADILAASGSQPLQRSFYELDLHLGTSGATIHDIMAASATLSATADFDEEASVEVMDVDTLGELLASEVDLDFQQGTSEAAKDVLAACGRVASASEPTTFEELIMAGAHGGEDSVSLPIIADHVAAASPGSHPVDHSAPCEVGAKTASASRKVFISPALLWLEEEGLPAVKEVLALGAEEEEEEMVRIALEIWKKMNQEERALWRKKAREVINRKN